MGGGGSEEGVRRKMWAVGCEEEDVRRRIR